jgi:transposase
MFRILEFAHKFQLTIQLAYYPPYHSKYNPIERAFGWLEQHWSGSLLRSVDTILKFASTLTFKGKNPYVTLINRVYHTGVKLTDDAMAEVEKQIQRLPNLKKWFVEIFGNST